MLIYLFIKPIVGVPQKTENKQMNISGEADAKLEKIV